MGKHQWICVAVYILTLEYLNASAYLNITGISIPRDIPTLGVSQRLGASKISGISTPQDISTPRDISISRVFRNLGISQHHEYFDTSVRLNICQHHGCLNASVYLNLASGDPSPRSRCTTFRECLRGRARNST